MKGLRQLVGDDLRPVLPAEPEPRGFIHARPGQLTQFGSAQFGSAVCLELVLMFNEVQKRKTPRAAVHPTYNVYVTKRSRLPVKTSK